MELSHFSLCQKGMDCIREASDQQLGAPGVSAHKKPKQNSFGASAAGLNQTYLGCQRCVFMKQWVSIECVESASNERIGWTK
eukprot:351672-Chlamydomonas_euryale.AAC.2